MTRSVVRLDVISDAPKERAPVMWRKGRPEAPYGFFDRPQTSEPVCPPNTPVGPGDRRCVDQTPRQ